MFISVHLWFYPPLNCLVPAKTISAQSRRAMAAGTTFDAMLENWIPMTHALNSINHGQGLPDLYPFVLSDAVLQKLRLVHEVVPPPGNLEKNIAAMTRPVLQEVSLA